MTRAVNGTVYLLSRHDHPVDKKAAEEACSKSGGSLAKLDGGMSEFEHLKAVIYESQLLDSSFLINEELGGGYDEQVRIAWPDQFDGETCNFIKQAGTTKKFQIFDRYPCTFNCKFICEVPDTTTFKDRPTENLLSRFHVSRAYQDKVYLITKKLEDFTFTEAMNTCRMYGGYLLKVKDDSELQYVGRVIEEFGMDLNRAYFTSGNRLRNKRDFRWGNSFEHMSMPISVPWLSFKNKRRFFRRYHCVSMIKPGTIDWLMSNFDCKTVGSSYFVCEVDLVPL